MRTLLIVFALASVLAACHADPPCPPGQVPNDLLQSCVTPPPCDGGAVDERNECVLAQATEEADAGGRLTGVAGRNSDAGGLAGRAGGGGGRAGTSGADAGMEAGRGSEAGRGDSAGRGGSGGAAGRPGPTCGDGHVDPGEACDGNCPTSCPAPMGCLRSALKGTATDCTAECVTTEVTTIKVGDGCCPKGADAATDSDCPKSCGDGVVDTTESCEPTSKDKPCPTVSDCDDSDPCTMDTLSGTAEQCTAKCGHTPIARKGTSCVDSDPCTDDTPVPSSTSCSYECPHNRRQPEPANCADTDPCTDDTPVMSSTSCSYTCPHARREPESANCADTDPCTDDTPVRSSTSCSYTCPHARREPEPANCADPDPCTDDTPAMSSTSCSYTCPHARVTARVNGDSCCPDGEDNRTDSDCTSTIYRKGETVCQGLNGNAGNPNVAVCFGANNVKLGEAGYTDDLGTFYYRADGYRCRDSSPLCTAMLSSADTFKFLPGSGTKSGPVQLAQGERPQAAIACTCQ
jgi:hypothetical protein